MPTIDINLSKFVYWVAIRKDSHTGNLWPQLETLAGDLETCTYHATKTYTKEGDLEICIKDWHRANPIVGYIQVELARTSAKWAHQDVFASVK